MNTGAPTDTCPTITIIFYRGKGGWYNSLIRLWTWSKYSHCEVVMSSTSNGNQYLTADHDRGVFLRGFLKGQPGEWERITLPLMEQERQDIQTFILGELGSGYDWKGIFLSQIMGLRREHPDKWFCSELCAAVLKRSMCGLALLRDRPCTYSPGSLRKALLPAGS